MLQRALSLFNQIHFHNEKQNKQKSILSFFQTRDRAHIDYPMSMNID